MLTASEVAEDLGCSVETVRRMVRSGRLPAFRLGRTYRFDEAEVRQALAANQRPEPRPAPAAPVATHTAPQSTPQPPLVAVRGPYIPPLED